MKSPFEDNDAEYFVLLNGEGQYSLWPVFADIPAGWTCQLGPESKSQCTDFINANWMDMRPKSLVDAIHSGQL